MVAGLKYAVAKLFGLRGGELGRALPVAAVYGLVLASMYVLKPARNALFLGRFGAAQLPYALILVALVGGMAAAVYARTSKPTRAARIVLVLFPILALNLVAFWVMLSAGGWDFLVYAFYVWVNLYGLVATSLIWLIANAVFDAREARRVFGLIGAGGIAGAILGGAFTQVAVGYIGTLNLLLVCVGMLIVSAVIAQIPKPLDDTEPTTRRRDHDSQDSLWKTPLLGWLVPMVGLAALVSVTVDIQFNAVVDETFASTDRKTGFFGEFFAVLNLFAFLFQLFATPRILKRLGVGNALFVLPVSLALGSAAVAVAPVLAVALVPKSADGGFRHSLHKAASEILYLPLSNALKQRAKLFLDSTVDNLGTGIGAILALVVTSVFALHYRYLGLVTVGAAALWVGVTVQVRRAYLDAFRRALLRRELDPDAHRVELADAASIRSLLSALDSDNERQITYALDMLESVEDPAVVDKTARLLDHSSAEVRAKALRVLSNQPKAAALKRAQELTGDSDPHVRVEALHYLCTRNETKRPDQLREFLHSSDDALVATALGVLAKHWPDEASDHLSSDLVVDLLERPGPHGVAMRRELARLVGESSDLAPVRDRLSRDQAPEVLAAAIDAAGRARDEEQIPWLVQELGNRRVRRHARHALARYGTTALPALRNALSDPELPAVVRQTIPRVLARIPHQRTVDLLIELAPHARATERLHLIKALSKLRNSTHLRFDRRDLTPLLDEEIRWHAKLVEMCRNADEPITPAAQLLWRALGEKQHETLERTFRLLGLMYPPKDIYSAYLGIVSGHRVVKASAIEFLDNLLERDVKRRLVPMLEAEPVPGIEASIDGPWLLPLLKSQDAWLRTCAVYNANLDLSPAIEEQVRRAQHDPDPVIRETALLVLGRQRG